MLPLLCDIMKNCPLFIVTNCFLNVWYDFIHTYRLTNNILILKMFLFEYLHCKFFNIHWSFSQLKKLNYLKGWREIEILIDGKRNLIVDIVYQFISLWSASLETCAEIDLNIWISQDRCMSFTLLYWIL